MKKLLFRLCTILLLCIAQSSYAQLAPFTIGVTATHQTCLGNGSLSFTINGTTPGASIEFEVYLLPNTTTPVTTVTVNNAQNLVAGNYMVLATQTLNNTFNTATGNATIIDNIVPLSYTAEGMLCGTTGTITVNVLSGTAIGYEIIAGPVLVGQQASNVFTGLPAGQYQVRVYDACGDAFVTTVQLQAAVTGIDFFGQEFPYGQLPSCNTITVKHSFSAVLNGAQILWPLNFEFIVHPPGGGANVVVTQQVEMGTVPQINSLFTELPFYNDQEYSYDVVITDACGNEFAYNEFIINRKFDFVAGLETDSCNNFYFGFIMANYRLPGSIAFTNAPAGFNPGAYNTSYPAITTEALVYGSDSNPLPYGDYTIQITDACGRTATHDIQILGEGIPLATGSVEQATCQGLIYIKTAFNRNIVSVHIVAAPAGYAVPQDVSSYIDGYEFLIGNMPLGDYVLELVDECGNSHTIPVSIIAPPVNYNVSSGQAPGCNVGEGSVVLFITGNVLDTVSITVAPDDFGQLPFDASAGISEDGSAVYLNSLPAGTYTFEMTDTCGNLRTTTLEIEGYEIFNNNTQIIPNCGSFDIDLKFSDNTQSLPVTFWLQKFNEVTQQWENPLTGQPFTGVFSPQNSYQLFNNQYNANNPFTGTFRIVKAFYVLPNGTNYTANYCTNQIYTFTYTGKPQITAAYAFPCDNGLAEVIIEATGKAPLQYSITTKNGQPFVVNNAGSNVFLALEEAVYNFQVTDACSNVINILYDITTLNPLEIEGDGFCNGGISYLTVPQYTFLTYRWWKEGNPGTILSTINTLDFPAFIPQDDAGTYMLHIVSTTPGSCIDTVLQYTTPLQVPQAGNDATIAFCDPDLSIDLSAYLSGTYDDGGTWQNVSNAGTLTGSVFVTAAVPSGTYVFKYIVNRCDGTDTALITLEIGNIPFEVAIEGSCTGTDFVLGITNLASLTNVKTIVWSGPAGYNYTGTEAAITGLAPGDYKVTVTNTDGCKGTATLNVPNTGCTISKGVSPNGDGLNDNLNLAGLNVKYLKIFNRYGLQVYEKENYIDEWYGQSDKGDLVTGTYFYAITLLDGKQVTGWVYLQRDMH